MNFDYILSTWLRLNEALKDADESACVELLNYESNHGRRYSFLLRIQRRINKLRAFRERGELEFFKKEHKNAASDD